ncbi:ImmA/IrrE family metallo-endopeptidase [Lacticaseibacillus sp. 53-4]|uniref:ImmA/IrrE family metallo-endopeptidase n=1 Tax=Lacticaseibacillus sp. 53-4 TaxID=2799575 RepID=UPI001EF267BB|nr:hypothetical protein [Lacticaseibacillus sp. 53-4]
MRYEAESAIVKARSIVNRYNNRDPWTVAEYLPGVQVVKRDLGTNIMGYTLVAARRAIISLNTAQSYSSASGVLAHELGHSQLTRSADTNYFYRNASVARTGSAEYIANCFMFQFMFGDRGGINPLNYDQILDEYELPQWMVRYFDLIN